MTVPKPPTGADPYRPTVLWPGIGPRHLHHDAGQDVADEPPPRRPSPGPKPPADTSWIATTDVRRPGGPVVSINPDPRMSQPYPGSGKRPPGWVEHPAGSGVLIPTQELPAVVDAPASAPGVLARNPVTTIATLTSAVPVILAALVALKIIHLTTEEQVTVAAGAAAVITVAYTVAGALMIRAKVTPVARPRDNRGVPLVPADTCPAPTMPTTVEG